MTNVVTEVAIKRTEKYKKLNEFIKKITQSGFTIISCDDFSNSYSIVIECEKDKTYDPITGKIINKPIWVNISYSITTGDIYMKTNDTVYKYNYETDDWKIIELG